MCAFLHKTTGFLCTEDIIRGTTWVAQHGTLFLNCIPCQSFDNILPYFCIPLQSFLRCILCFVYSCTDFALPLDTSCFSIMQCNKLERYAQIRTSPVNESLVKSCKNTNKVSFGNYYSLNFILFFIPTGCPPVWTNNVRNQQSAVGLMLLSDITGCFSLVSHSQQLTDNLRHHCACNVQPFLLLFTCYLAEILF